MPHCLTVSPPSSVEELEPTDGTKWHHRDRWTKEYAPCYDAWEGIPVNIGLLGKGNAYSKAPLQEQIIAGAVGLKVHEDRGCHTKLAPPRTSHRR